MYKILVTKDDDGYSLESREFDLTLLAQSFDEGMEMMRGQITNLGVDLLSRGVALPTKIDDGYVPSSVYLDIDFDKEFRRLRNSSVRKNISLPEWMDVQLKVYGIDSSKLFQEAATRLLDSYKIRDLNSLLNVVGTETVDSIMKEYSVKKLAGQI